MTNKDLTKIYFQGNEIVALYRGDTLIFKKSSGGGSTTEPTGVYTVRGTLKPDSREQNIQLCVNGQREQFDVNNDKTFEYTFINVPVTNMDYFTLACKDELKTLDLSDLDTSQVTSMIQAFCQCNKLEEIILTNFDTSNVTDMTRMFTLCQYLTDIDLSSFDTSKVTNMSFMFSSCSNLTSLDVSNFDTSNVTNMSSMFNGCSKLTSLDLTNFDTSKVTDMSYMFFNNHKLTSLDLSNFDTSKVTDMSYMFFNNHKLTSLDLSNFDTSKVTNMSYMFDECTELKDLYINFDLKSISVYQPGIFTRCISLTNVVGKFNNYKYNLGLENAPLTAASAMVIINGLATVTEKRRLTLSATTYDSLTTEQIAIATAKGWTVTRN